MTAHNQNGVKMTQRKKAKTRTMYMHTLEGKPAYYEPGRQIVFAGWKVPAYGLAPSLRALRAQKRWSDEWRAKQKYEADFRHSYVRIVLDV